MGWHYRMTIMGLMVIFTTACGGGNRTVAEAGIVPVAKPTEEGYSGVAMKGRLHDALVVAEWYNGGLWQELDRAHTDQGRFLLDIGEIDGLVRLTVSLSSQRASRMLCDVPSGCAGGEFGDWIALSDGFQLRTLVTAEQFRAGEVAITPLTHLMAEWAQRLPGGLSQNNLDLARNRVAALFGLPDHFTALIPADPNSVAFFAASDAARLHGVLSAAFAAQGAEVPVAEVLQSVSATFTRFAGQLPLEGRYGLLELLGSARAVASALGEGEQLLASASARVAQWHQVSAANPALAIDWDQARFAALTNELEYYASGAALLDLDAALRRQAGQYLWLPRAEIPAMMQVAYTSLGHALDAAVNGERKLIEANSQCALWRPNRCYTYVVLHQDDSYSATMRAFPSITDLLGFLTGGSISPRVEIVGSLHGQQVDINLRVPTPGSQLFNGGLSRVQMEVIAARVGNQQAVAHLSGVLALGLPGLDLLDFFSTLTPLLTDGDDPLAVASSLLAIMGSVAELQLTVSGQGTLAEVTAPADPFRATMSLQSSLGIAALTGGDGGLLSLRLLSGEIETPLGDRLFSLPGQAGLAIDVGPIMAASVAFGVAVGDLPKVHVALGGAVGLGELWPWLTAMTAGLISGGADLAMPSIADWSLSGNASLIWPGLQIPYDVHWNGGGLLFNQVGSSESALVVIPSSDRGGYLMLGEQLIATMTLDPLGAGLAAHFIDGDQHALSAAPLLSLLGWGRGG
ncbi:MAG: hypothetical protein ACK4SX_06280 [Alcanivoracaceae bacterium]